MTRAAKQELNFRAKLKALEQGAGSWKDKDHPELSDGAEKWVAKLRQQDEHRFTRVTSQ